jgi:S1-C subfamily serine protease
VDETARYLGERPDSLSSTLTGVTDRPAAIPATARRVSFGSVPDFTYTGNGVRLDDVRPGSPAQQAGLRRGDIIIQVNAQAVDGLRAYSDALKKLAPGDGIRVRYLRDGLEQSLHTRVTAR